MKFLLLISIVTTLAISGASGQNVNFKRPTSCTNRDVEEIASRGIIKIGARIDEVLSLFASTEEEKQRIRNSASGRKRTNIGFEFFSAPTKPEDERFEGISHYIFNFLDNRLVSFEVGYTKPRWKNAKQFAEKMSEIFDLPPAEYWSDGETQTALQCENYRLQIHINNDSENARSHFSVYDNRIVETLKQREQKFEDEQRDKDLKSFKP